jgi:phenylalanyl-tRNA synthetase alpha chain
MQDSFWVKVEGAPDDARTLLRTHTSNVQVRAMSTHKPPMAFIAPGTTYRRDDDATHSPMFHQIECFLVDEHVTLAHLRGVLSEFAERFFGSGTPVRLRPSYFPFVEPGAEVDVGCPFCRQPDGTRAGCSVCKRTGWIEILGCGMIHPVVFESCGIDPEKWTGFAFGMGLERVAVVRYGIPDMRILFENDPRFLAQF